MEGERLRLISFQFRKLIQSNSHHYIHLENINSFQALPLWYLPSNSPSHLCKEKGRETKLGFPFCPNKVSCALARKERRICLTLFPCTAPARASRTAAGPVQQKSTALWPLLSACSFWQTSGTSKQHQSLLILPSLHLTSAQACTSPSHLSPT